MFILFIPAIFLLGLYLLSFFPKDLPRLVKISMVYIFGTYAITAYFFVLYPLFRYWQYINYFGLLLLFIFFLIKRKNIMKSVAGFNRVHFGKADFIVLLFTLLISSFLFLKTTWFDPALGQTTVMGKLWSDFGAHIPLIRSFFYGYNFPPEYPLFAHAPIKYYFMFHFHAALLEYFNLPLFLAIDVPSILSFTCLMVMIYSFGCYLFKSRITGLIGILMFIFNGSLSWWYFIQKNLTPDIKDLFYRLISQKEFAAFNPYDGTLVSGGFWNLNVYTNQRHLPLSLTLLFIFIFLFVWKRYNNGLFHAGAYFCLGVISGLTVLFHGVIFLMAGLLSPLFWLFENQKRKFFYFFISFVLLAVPSLLYLRLGGTNAASGVKFLPGYLTAYDLTLFNFVRYWALNLGLLLVLTPLGLLFSTGMQRLLIVFTIPVFLIGNLLSFSTDVATNHKFFNFTVIIFNLYAAYLLSRILNIHKTNIIRLIVIVVLLFFTTVSGIIDVFPVINDSYFGVPDPSHKPDIEWIRNNTAKDAVIANSYYLFHPASIAGRRIPLGWPYFAWSAGYDTNTRVRNLTELYLAKTKSAACQYVKALGADFVSLNLLITDVNLKFDADFWRRNFPLVYENKTSGFMIFEAKKGCNN